MEGPVRTGRSLNLPVFLAAALLVGAAAALCLLWAYEPHTATSRVEVLAAVDPGPGVQAQRLETLKPGPGPELRRALGRIDEAEGLDPALLEALDQIGAPSDRGLRGSGLIVTEMAAVGGFGPNSTTASTGLGLEADPACA